MLRGVGGLGEIRPDDIVQVTGDVEVEDGRATIEADVVVVERRASA